MYFIQGGYEKQWNILFSIYNHFFKKFT